MEFIGQRPKQETIAAYRDHVSSGKAAFFSQYGMDFAGPPRGRLSLGCRRRGAAHQLPLQGVIG